MIMVLVRIASVVLLLWLLWRMYVAMTRSSKAAPADAQDEWTEVLEAIDELPETTEAQVQVAKRQRQGDRPPSPDNLETVIVHEAETALARIREGDATERLASYYEIITYEKLCRNTACGISEATREKVDRIRQQAWLIMHPREQN